jgi:metal-dependent HD superfamily phosphatase/phosphodiesterase
MLKTILSLGWTEIENSISLQTFKQVKMGIPNGAKPIKIKEISFSNSGVASINNKLNMKTLDSIINKKILVEKKNKIDIIEKICV